MFHDTALKCVMTQHHPKHSHTVVIIHLHSSTVKKINCFVIVKFLNKISEFRMKFFSSMYTEEICQKMLTKLNLSASESISKNLLILSLFMTNSNSLIPNYSEIYHRGIT